MTFGNVISAAPAFGSNLTDDIYLHESGHVNDPIERGLGRCMRRYMAWI